MVLIIGRGIHLTTLTQNNKWRRCAQVEQHILQKSEEPAARSKRDVHRNIVLLNGPKSRHAQVDLWNRVRALATPSYTAHHLPNCRSCAVAWMIVGFCRSCSGFDVSGWNDVISSICVPSGAYITIYQNSYWGGDSTTVDARNSSTARFWTSMSWWWNDATSSFKTGR